MSRDFNTNTANNDEWLTPPVVLGSLGFFDLDPCSPGDRSPWRTANLMLALPTDGLAENWHGRVWLNPPYGRETFKWLEKLSTHKGGGIALIFARTETIGFHEQIWNKAHSVFFFKGRLKFWKVDGTEGDCANAPSCLVSYTESDTRIIEQAVSAGCIKGRMVKL